MEIQNKYVASILNELLDKYERSLLSSGSNERKIHISITRKDKPFSLFLGPKSYNYIDEFETCLDNLSKLNFTETILDKNNQFERVVMCLERVNEIYKFLNRRSKNEKIVSLITVIKGHKYRGWLEAFRIDCIERLGRGNAIKNIKDENELEEILKAFDLIDSLDTTLKERDFSVKVYRDSKKFSSLRNKIASIAREFGNFHQELSNDEIIEEIGIIKNSSYVLVKNNLVFRIGKQTIRLNDFVHEFSLSDDMIKELKLETVESSKVVTIENLTTFYQFQDNNAVVVYLAGYHNHTKREFLKLLYKTKPDLEFYHFGDIDVGGFRILNNLRNDTGIPFKPLFMGIDELSARKNETKQLSENDIRQISLMIEQTEYQEFKNVLEFMLQNNIKLEQESLD